MLLTSLRVFAIGLCLLLVGCESARHDFAARVSEKVNGPTYVRRVYSADASTVFEASRVTAEALGFRITRAGSTQGVIDGVSGLASDDRLSGSRQLTLKIRLVSTLEGSTEVAVLFTEIIEDDFDKAPGQGTETSLRDHPLYESFFGELSRQLAH